jgi:hypothetical protein
MKTIKICWIIPPYTQLKLIPGKNSLLKKLISKETVISYDGQINYPHSTTTLRVVRELQSALGNEIKLKASILNLAAVPREKFIDNTWEKEYLGKTHKIINYGFSKIECKRIGKDITTINNLDVIVESNDLIVIPSSFETHVPEIKRLASFLKSNYDKIILTSGSGIEGHEEELLESGFDIVFNGAISDNGEKVLEAIVNKEYDNLAAIPGVNSNLGKNKVRNLGARSFRRPNSERLNFIREWKKNLPKYNKFVDINFDFVGRPDLITNLKVSPAVEYCCAMQDLDYNTVSGIVKRDNIVFAADEFFLDIGCPRNCEFCHAAGRGHSTRNLDYSLKLLDFYKSLGVTDLIPTDDQIFLGAVNNKKFAKELIQIYQHAKNLEFGFFYGNGVETYALARLIESTGNNTSQNLLKLFIDTASYVYVPYEDILGFSDSPEKAGLAKLSGGKQDFERVLEYLNKNSASLEVGTNIIFSEVPNKQEINDYYNIMDKTIIKYSNLKFRYGGFFMIPSNCAPHIKKYNKKYDLSLVKKYPELKIVSIPLIKQKKERANRSEEILSWNIEARNNSQSRRKLAGGTYITS